jgi:hypothetical protein
VGNSGSKYNVRTISNIDNIGNFLNGQHAKARFPLREKRGAAPDPDLHVLPTGVVSPSSIIVREPGKNAKWQHGGT